MALTVGELKKALEGVPDRLEIKISNDIDLDQGKGPIVVGGGYMVKYKIGKVVKDYYALYVYRRPVKK